MSGVPEIRGTLQAALAQVTRLMETSPRLAADQAMEILKVAPAHAPAMVLLGVALRLSGDAQGAVRILEPLVNSFPGWSALQYEFALALSQLGRTDPAIVALRCAVDSNPDMAVAWRALGDHLMCIGDADGADKAYARDIKASTKEPRLLVAAAALCNNEIPLAEALLRDHLKKYPTDVAAIRMFAEVAARLRRYGDAEVLLARCLELAPSFTAARHNHAIVLHRQSKSAAALREVDGLLSVDARNPGYNNLKAAILAKIGELDDAIDIYAGVLARDPLQPKVWMSYGHALKTAGREADSIDAYRRSIALSPHLGEAYWSLANLKTVRFSRSEVLAIGALLSAADLGDEDRWHLEFAMGKALEDDGDFARSFAHYAEGNRLRRVRISYDPAELSTHVRRSKALFTKDFFSKRAGFGSASPDPIFIVGLPRAGSTLIEQILASHSQVEGTMELPDIPGIAKSLFDISKTSGGHGYTEALARCGAEECRRMGDRYLEQTRIQRRTAAPRFIDKMPNNFAHVELITLILPRARIIDARRHPMACCFSGFKQHFARGQSFTYSLEDIGAYYRDYVELMAHYDAVLPGHVHRVIYEDLVGDTELEVRRLLDFCGLSFEESCLRFHENDRFVRTASSQQVRQPIFKEGVDQWRHFEPWLGALKASLGNVLDCYPLPPDFENRPGL